MSIQTFVTRVLIAASVGSLVAVGAAVPASAAAGQTKTFAWGEIHRGDCVQENGVLVVDSSGHGTFTAGMWTNKTHTKDVWHSSFFLQTSARTGLFSTRTFDSEAMDDDGSRYRVTWTFDFDEDLFDAIGIATQFSRC